MRSEDAPRVAHRRLGYEGGLHLRLSRDAHVRGARLEYRAPGAGGHLTPSPAVGPMAADACAPDAVTVVEGAPGAAAMVEGAPDTATVAEDAPGAAAFAADAPISGPSRRMRTAEHRELSRRWRRDRKWDAG